MFKENGKLKVPEKVNLETCLGKLLKCEVCNVTYHIETAYFGEAIHCPKCKAFLIEETTFER